MLPIKQNLTTVNYTKRNNRKPEWIVLHYTAGDGDTAKNNTDYFKSTDRQASAHYFVDEKEIWMCVDPSNDAWSVGGGYSGTYFGKCTNQNSINIEMCSEYGDNGYYINKETFTNTIELTKTLMKQYNIPLSNVIRHFDVNKKICPAPFVNDQSQWETFRAHLSVTPHIIKEIYRVATKYENGVYKNQKGAFVVLDNAKKCCDANKGTQVFDWKGNKVYPTTAKYYRVVVTTDVLNVRTGPGTNYDIATQVHRDDVYTIVAESGNWGKLKSGVGYICLDYTEKL